MPFIRPSLAPLAATFVLLATSSAPAIEKGTPEKPQKQNLKPGEYVWDPQAESAKGALDIVVSLGEQELFVYRDGVQIGRSTVSSGSKGRETPTGIYMILEKNVTHHSNKYHEASMPFMERLTWGGLAIHAGNTPGHPESHGCMHVPEDFAKKLYSLTEEGNTVLVANGSNDKPEPTADPNQLFADAAPTTSGGDAPAFTWKPEEVPTGPVAIVISSADKNVHVYRKGVEIGKADLTGPDAGHSYGNFVYAALAQAGPDSAQQWNLLGKGDGSSDPDLAALTKNAALPPEFRQKLRDVIKPGTTLVITDHPANPTKSATPDAED